MREIIVDNFAGGGGASTGIEEALRLLYENGLVDEELHIDYAVNHDAWACAMHHVNHPKTIHLRNNVWSVDPDSIDGPIGLGWFSPDCKHFSKAKGGKPVEKGIRDLAWVVVRWARRKKGGPRIIMLENVEEFRSWGPLGEDGKPCPLQKGRTFKRWVRELRRLGYKVEHRELRGCDYGDPTIRKRLFVIARRDGEPIVWPPQTHGNPVKILAAQARVAAGATDAETVYLAGLPPWKTAAGLIDWTLPCPSIFMTRDEGRQYKKDTGIQVVRPLQPKTMARIAAGLDRYVINCEKPYIVNLGGKPFEVDDIEATNGAGEPYDGFDASAFISNLTHQGGDRNQPVTDPVATVTGAHRGEKALVVPYVSVAQQGGSNRSIEDPLNTVTASDGDQNQLIVPTLIQSGYGEREGQRPRVLDLDQPLGTVVADGIKHALVTPYITGVGGRMGQTEPRGVDQPAQTVTSKADSVVVAPVLQSYYGHGAGGDNRSASVEEPLRTQTTENRHAIIVPSLVRTAHGDVDKKGKKRGRGDHSLGDPFSTVTGSPDHALVAPHLTKFRTGSVGSSMEEPVPTVTANSFVERAGGAAPIGVVAAHVQRHYGESVGHGMDAPSATVAATGGGKSALIAASLVKNNFGEKPHYAVDEPMKTIVAGGNHHALIATHLMTMRNSGKPFSATEEPTHTVTSGGARLHLVAAFMAQHNLGVVGHEMEEPVSTILQKGSQQNLVAANLTRQFGTAVGSPIEEPLRTVMTEGAGGKTALTAAFLQSYFGSLQDPKIEDPMHTVTTKDRFGLCVVSIYGERYIITDIGMRMLSPRELFRAQGFRDSYIIDWGIAVQDDEELGWKAGQRVEITKTQQVSKCGNSVNPGVACALAFANYCPLDVPEEEQPEFFLQAAE